MSDNSKYKVLHSKNAADAQWAGQLALYLSVALEQLTANTVSIDLTEQFDNNAFTIIVISDNSLSDVSYTTLISDVLKSKALVSIALLSNDALAQASIPSSIVVNRFYDWDNELGQYRLFAPTTEGASQRQFCNRVLDMALNIAVVSKTDNKRKAFVAETSPDQFRVRDLVVWELEKRGYSIFPTSLPSKQNEITKIIKDSLQDAELFVHIVGNMYAPVIDESELSLVELQMKLSSEFIHNNPKHLAQRIIWIPSDFNSVSAKQNELVQHIKNDERDTNTDLLQAPVDDLMELLIKKTEPLKQNTAIHSSSSNSAKALYLIYDAVDGAKAQIIRDYLKVKDIEVLEPALNGSSVETMNLHRKCLATAEKVVLLHSSGSRLWLQSKIKDIQKAPGYGRTKPFTSAILLNASGSVPTELQLPGFIETINIDTITPPVLDNCLKHLKNG